MRPAQFHRASYQAPANRLLSHLGSWNPQKTVLIAIPSLWKLLQSLDNNLKAARLASVYTSMVDHRFRLMQLVENREIALLEELRALVIRHNPL
jgi:hypothetical protein